MLPFVIVALLGEFASEVLLSHEPVYEGRPLSAWLKDYDGCYDDVFTLMLASRWHKADLALQAMGTNALPILMAELGYHRSPAKVALVNWFNRHASPKFQLATEFERHGRALCGIRALGPDARPAIPVLTEFLKRSTNGEAFLWLDANWTLGDLSTNHVFTSCPAVQKIKPAPKQIDPDAAAKAGIK